MKLFVQSFGCQMSSADGTEMSRPLLARGFSATAELSEADAAIVNTCTVRQHAEDKAASYLGRLREWKRERPERFLIVAGCAAERLGAEVTRRFPFVDLVVGAKSVEQYPEILARALAERFDWAKDNAGAWDAPVPEASPASAFVTVMRGCNYSCAYCIVPSVRGRELYRPFETILQETRARVAGGSKEVMFLGQTVNSWRHGGKDFADLLRAAGAVPGLERIRFMSPHPFFLNRRMMEAMAQTEAVCPHLHLPAQSGSDRILKAMRRNYTAAEFLAKAAELRALIPNLELTTDFIVGFPGETEEDFSATVRLAREGDFCSAYCFKYSPREGTEAAGMPGQVPEDVKEERLARLLEVTEAGTEAHLARKVGTRVRVLLEDATDGKTEGCFKVRLEGSGIPRDIIDAIVMGHTRTALRCKPIDPQ